MRVSSIAFAVALAVGAMAVPVRAALDAQTGLDTIDNTVDPNGAQIGDTFSIPAGTFISYVASPGEPQITGNDLSNYGYTLTGTVTSVTGNVADYSGNYRIYYNLAGQSGYVAGTDPSVSFGNANLQAIFSTVPGTNAATFSGTLVETQGPSGPDASSFADLGSYYPVVNLNGLYTGSLTNLGSGTIQSTLTAVPEPTSISLLGIGALGLLRRRRRNGRLMGQ